MQYQSAAGNGAKDRNVVLLIAAFAAVYIFWGSTYLAIKFAIETIPPFIMAGSRFLIAGVILLLWARLSADYERPTLAHWRTSLIVGTLLLMGGNGLVVFAQHYISSSLAALMVATEPFWIVLLSWLWLKGGRPSLRAILGLVVGFVGVGLLIVGQGSGSAGAAAGGGQLLGTLAVVGAALAWATGSIYGLRAPVPKSSILTAGMQMISGGAVLMIASVLRGEWRTFDITSVSSDSLYAVGYLIVFGSLIGFTSYSWLLKNAQPAMVATYAYVNPVIAVLLGWFIAGESMSGQMLLGAGIIVGSVVLITSQSSGELNDTEPESIADAKSACAASASASA